MRKTIFYGAVLIGVYIATAYATGFGKDVSSVASGTATVVKSLQGR